MILIDGILIFGLLMKEFFPIKAKEPDIAELPKISSTPSCKQLPLILKDW